MMKTETDWKTEAEQSNNTIQLVKRGKRKTKVLASFENKNFIVTRLTYRNASKTMWSDIEIIGCDVSFCATRSALVSLHTRLTEVLAHL